MARPPTDWEQVATEIGKVITMDQEFHGNVEQIASKTTVPRGNVAMLLAAGKKANAISHRVDRGKNQGKKGDSVWRLKVRPSQLVQAIRDAKIPIGHTVAESKLKKQNGGTPIPSVRGNEGVIDDEPNQKRRILRWLYPLVDRRGDFVGKFNILTMANETQVDIHNLQHVLRSMQGQGLLKVKERRGGGGGANQRTKIVDVHLFDTGLEQAKQIWHESGRSVPPVHEEKSVSVAPTVPRDTLVAVADESGVTLRPFEGEKERPQNVKIFSEKYPLIDNLMRRRTKVELAAKMLEQLGLVELGAQALVAAEHTDLEKEIIAYVREHPDE